VPIGDSGEAQEFISGIALSGLFTAAAATAAWAFSGRTGAPPPGEPGEALI